MYGKWWPDHNLIDVTQECHIHVFVHCQARNNYEQAFVKFSRVLGVSKWRSMCIDRSCSPLLTMTSVSVANGSTASSPTKEKAILDSGSGALRVCSQW